MLIAQNYVHPMHKIFRLYSLISTSLYEKSKDGQNSGYISLSSRAIKKFPIMIGLSVLFILALLSQFIFALNNGHKLPTDSLVPSIQYILSLTLHIPTLVQHYKKREDVCSLFNLFLDFERRHNGKNFIPHDAKKGLGVRTKHFLNIIMGTGPLYAIFYWQHMVVRPCFPGNLGYFIIPQCQLYYFDVQKLVITVSRISLATFSAWIYLFTFATVVEEFAITVMQPYCIINYLRLFLHKIKEMEERASIRNGKDIDLLLSFYREIELLVSRYNRIHAGPLSLTTVSDISSAFIVSLYTVVGLNSEAPMPLLILCSVLVFDICLVIFELDGNIKSGVYRLSKRVCRKAMTSKKFGKNRHTRRVLRSWRVLRIYLGSTNFYDISTPLTLLGFCISNTVNLLLM